MPPPTELQWMRPPPGSSLEHGEGVVLELPIEALPALLAALQQVLGVPSLTDRAAVLEEAWWVERERSAMLLILVREYLAKPPVILGPGAPTG
jgi:hypothetical protein